MNVLFVVDSLSYGGAGRVVSILANEFQNRMGNVSIALMGKNNKEQEHYNLDNKIKLYFLDDYKKMQRLSAKKCILFLRNIMKSGKIDICISFMNIYSELSVVASLFLRTKVIVSERNDPHFSPKEKVYRIFRNPLYLLADCLVCQTKDMIKYFPHLIQRKAIVIYNPINQNLPDPFIGERKKRVVSVGKLSKQKNYSVAIRAFAKFAIEYNDYVYEIYGEGDLRTSLENEIAELNLSDKVFLHGHNPNVFDEIKDAALFIMSSDYEGMSNALIEAMALGIPSISTNHPIGGAKELINDRENGMLVPCNSPDSLYSAMSEVISDIDLRNNISHNAIDVRKTLSKENTIEIWIKTIEKVMGKQR